jgi:hypothetical protein
MTCSRCRVLQTAAAELTARVRELEDLLTTRDIAISQLEASLAAGTRYAEPWWHA